MSQIPIIPLEQPVEIPPTEPKVFDAIWISQLSIRTLPPTDQTGGGLVEIEYLPMNSQTFETFGQPQSIRSDKLMTAVFSVPEVAQALGAILLAFEPLKQFEEQFQ